MTNIISIIRVIIDDDVEPYVYSDERLTKLVLVSALQVKQENALPANYIINLAEGTIEPEPDEVFTNLIILKSLCSLNTAKLYKFSSSGISIFSDQFMRIDFRGVAESSQSIMKDSCQAYKDAKLAFARDKLDIVAAIIGPHKVYYNLYHTHRQR